MARPASPMRDEAIADIRTLTAKHGAREGARLAREKFPSVPYGTFVRWRQDAIGRVDDADMKATSALGLEIRRAIPNPETLGQAIENPVPAAHRALRFWEQLDLLLHDADLLRAYSLSAGPDGKLKVRVPRALMDAANMRRDLMKIALAQAEAAYGVERAATFFETIIGEIGQESPECQRRILDRLARVQGEAAARGF
ncbi:hypothetical protein [Ottowia thiooxydans]|uniref:Uncharacterized protein n=1 Tax=Ottowia thiooxydans TaxID=219182 RepID=A0ABV2Q7B7_9BURK